EKLSLPCLPFNICNCPWFLQFCPVALTSSESHLREVNWQGAMDPNFLTKRSFAELKSMPFDSLYEGVYQQGQISQQLLQDFKLPMPQLSNIRSKHGALPRPAGYRRQRSTQVSPPYP
ncbi:hypothetical protein DUNSADRAFT_2502, partial [Dunaliella salina]